VTPRDFRLYLLAANRKYARVKLGRKSAFGYTLLVQNHPGDHYSRVPSPSTELQAVPSPNNPPWGSFAALGVWVGSVFFILVVPTLLLLPYLMSAGPGFSDPNVMVEFAKSDPTSVFLQIFAILPAHILTLLIAWPVVTKANRFSFRQTLGWEKGGFEWWYYIIILVGFLVIAAGVSKFFPEQENDLIKILQSSRAAVYIVAVVATFTAPIVEEVVYRGVLYSAFQRTMGVTAAFIVATLLFALVHVPQYWPSYSTILLLTFLSFILTAIRVKTGNLLPCIILHTLFNGLQSIFLIISPPEKLPEVPEKIAAFLMSLKW
jgi:uncharacterized protein